MVGLGGPKPGGAGLRPRMGGGFNQAMGQFGEHLDENSFKQASSQKALGQQAAQVTPQQMAAAQAQAAQQQSPGGAPAEPREVGTIKDEAKRAATDVWEQVKSFFSINTWLGVKPNTLTPEEQAKAKTVHQRYKQLDQEQQQVARQRYEKEMKRRQAIEEEKQRKAQQEAQAKQNSDIAVPSSPKKGPVGPGGSKKQKAVQKLQNDRKQLSGPGSAN